MKGNKAVFVVCLIIMLLFFKSATACAFDRTSLDALLAQKQCPRCDLQYARLSNSNLSGAYLPGANLSGANLSGSDLSGTNLSGAYLSGANWLDVITRCTEDSIGACSSWAGKTGQ